MLVAMEDCPQCVNMQQSCMAMCIFCSTLLNFVFVGKLGISPMDLGLGLGVCLGTRGGYHLEEENDDGICCRLCGHYPGDIFECGTCKLNMCASCMPLHSCTSQDSIVCS